MHRSHGPTPTKQRKKKKKRSKTKSPSLEEFAYATETTKKSNQRTGIQILWFLLAIAQVSDIIYTDLTDFYRNHEVHPLPVSKGVGGE